jgi:adenosylcobinamide kinase / adenosylcobinamide-phosphate guanylyltransferase
MYAFVTGGYRSGRSNYALRKASELGAPPWGYVSSGVEPDDSITKRTERHRHVGDATWITEPMPRDLADWLRSPAIERYGSIVLDGFPHWYAAHIQTNASQSDAHLLAHAEELADRLYRASRPVVLVTQEVGLAEVPSDPDRARVMRLCASANQMLANNAETVTMMVSGIPLRIR